MSDTEQAEVEKSVAKTFNIFSRQGTLDVASVNRDSHEVLTSSDIHVSVIAEEAFDRSKGGDLRRQKNGEAPEQREDQASTSDNASTAGSVASVARGIDADDVEEQKHAKRGLLQSARKKCGFFLYVIIMRGFMIGHEVALLYIHTFALKEIGRNPEQVYIDATPSLLVALELISLPLLCICRCWGKKHKCCGRVAIGGVYVYMIQGTMCYTLQVVVLMWRDMKAFIQQIPSYASCYCYQYYSAYYSHMMHINTTDTHRCHCYVPYVDTNKVFICHGNTTNHVKMCLDDHAINYTGTMNVETGESQAGMSEVPGLNSYTYLYILILLLQLSLVVLVVTFPFWTTTSQVLLEGKQEKAIQRVEEELDQEEAVLNTRWSQLRMNVRVYVNKQRIKREYKEKKLTSVQTAVGLSASGLAEGLDAFSLLDDMDSKRDYFAANEFLRDAVLAFVSITLLMITLSLFLTIIPQSEAVGNGIKIAMIIINNLPFLVLRSYMAQIFGGFGESSFIFLLFTIKEGMLILLGLVEVGSAMWGTCHSKDEKKEA